MDLINNNLGDDGITAVADALNVLPLLNKIDLSVR